MFASFDLRLGEDDSVNKSDFSLSMHLKRGADNKLRLELESSALVTSCECRIKEPEIHRLPHSVVSQAAQEVSQVSETPPQTALSGYPSPQHINLHTSRPTTHIELSRHALLQAPTLPPTQTIEPEVSVVSKLAAVSSANELTKCFHSTSNLNTILDDASAPARMNLTRSSSSSFSLAHVSDGEEDSSSDSDRTSQKRSRSPSLQLSVAASSTKAGGEQGGDFARSNGGSDAGSDSSSDSDRGNSCTMSALLQKVAVPRQTRVLDVKRGIDPKKQREKLAQAANLPLEALLSSDLVSAAVSVAKLGS